MLQAVRGRTLPATTFIHCSAGEGWWSSDSPATSVASAPAGLLSAARGWSGGRQGPEEVYEGAGNKSDAIKTVTLSGNDKETTVNDIETELKEGDQTQTG